ncbi:hypothetical protein FB45DRAFT_1092891 [Roridomyces roridus]|uniref:Uncharacterized protein n=1 Tax=Roridomyces roridus TaxID=1738132 RepID=A0AAD7FIU1_9AGAR|nr:hypothetical protein FB45DRAFT_1092891 [Roridomyces roridus]
MSHELESWKPWTQAKLDQELQAALVAADAPTYVPAIHSYVDFCCLHEFPITPTADTLSFYVVWMCQDTDPNTVGSYLLDICNELEPRFPQVREICKTPPVSRTLEGYILRSVASH